MDIQRFGIDERLTRAVEGLGVKTVFYEKMLEHAVQKNENVCAKINLSQGIEEVCVLPAIQWLASGAAEPALSRKVLVLAPDAEVARRAVKAASSLCAAIGAAACLVLEGEEGSGPAIEGDAAAGVAVGLPSSLLAAGQAGSLKLRDYGFVVALGAERLAELPPETMRRLAGLLLPSWERRAILACSKISVKAKNLAWDLADNPAEIHVEEEAANAQGVPRETWHIDGDSKFRFLLGLIGRERRDRLCVFCNLKGTAEEVARRLEANGVGSDYLLGALPLPRKLAILEKTKGGSCPVLVLTDQGAEGLPRSSFPLVVNFDIPLEPEYFVRRLELLDREAAGAKIVNMACDRYIYGLTAVEQHISDKFEVVEADESLLAAEDKSAGMSFERPRREEARRDDVRGPRREAEGPRDGRPRGQGGRGAYPREDRSPDIRRSISEATGGSLDVSGEAPPEHGPRDEGQRRPPRPDGRKPEGRRPEADRREEQRRREGARSPRDGRGAHARDANQRDAYPREGRQGGARRGRPSQPQAARGGNPYDLPMEERMRLYREKYGRGLEEGRDGSSRERRPQADDARREAPSRRQPSRPAPTAPEAEQPKEGFFRRLFGGARKQD
jgi:ATP-dependent RNA helicase RhlB